jgi:tetratricopeptide (TPR) repeat protein
MRGDCSKNQWEKHTQSSFTEIRLKYCENEVTPMPFVKKSGKKKAVPAQLDARRIFIGREQELHFLREHILDPEEPDYNLVSLYGQGGVGKSTLLSRLESDIRTTSTYKDSCLTAQVNERQLTPTSVMEAFADQLNLKGEFEKALGHYKESLRKLYDEREQEQETFGRKAAMALAGSVAKSVPVPVVNDLLSQGAEQVSGLIWDEVLSRQRLKDARRLGNPLQDLTDRFLTELNKLAERQGSGNRPIRRILLCFDTFEQLTTEIVPWLLDCFLPEEINENVVLVVAGRHELSKSTPDNPKRWLEYEHILHEIELKTFSREETALYLAQRGVTEATRVNQIWQLSHGFPLYLGMLTVNQNGKFDPTADVVQNLLIGIPAGEEVKQRLVLDAALFSRAFNRDDLKAFAYVGEDQRAELYRWLCLQSFIRDVESGRYSYHDIAQKMFCRYLYSSSPEDCRETRTSLATHYQKALAAVEASEGEHAAEVEEWLELALALIQQLLLLPDEEKLIQAVGLVVRAIGAEWETSRSEKVGNVLQRLQDGLGQQMTERARRLVKHLISYQSQMIEQPEWYNAVQEFIQKMLPSSQRFLESLVLLYFVRARAYREQEEYEKALRDFQHVLELNPQYSRAWYNQGVTLGKLKRYEEALAAYEEAIKLNTHYGTAWNNKGDMLDALSRSEEALIAYEESIKLNPHYTRAWYNKGTVLGELNRYEEALAAFEATIKLDSQFADAWFNKGVILRGLNKDKEALAAFEEALRVTTLNPSLALGWSTKGAMLSSLSRNEEALAAFDIAIKLNPQDAAASWFNKGKVYLNLENYEEAIACFDKTLALNSQDAEIWYYKGLALGWLNRFEEAIVYFDKALVINPQDVDAWNQRGTALSFLDRNEEALVSLDKALAIDPDHIYALSTKAYVLNVLKRYEETLECCDKALTVYPQYPNPLRHKGNALRGLHRYEGAIECFDKALALDPQYTNVWYDKGAMLKHLGRNEEALASYDKAVKLQDQSVKTEAYAEALEAYNEVIKLNPHDAKTWLSKGIVLEKLGRDEEAEMTYDEAIKLDPQNAIAWYDKGVRLGKLGRDEEALAAYDEAIKLEPHYTRAWYNKGIVLGFLNRYNEALMAFDKTVNLDSQNADAWLNKGVTLEKLGRDEEARIAFDEADSLKAVRLTNHWSIPGFRQRLSPDAIPEEYFDTEIVINLQGTNMFGDLLYTYLKVNGKNLKRLFATMRTGETFKPADFGVVLFAGRGDPPQEVRNEINKEYDVKDVPAPTPIPSLQPKDDEDIEG